MSAFFGEPTLKAATLDRLRQHRRLDQFVQGVYFENGKGCHLGCLTHSNAGSHEATVKLFGIPLRVAYLLEVIFEGLPTSACGWWAIASIEAIPVGADLSLAHHHLAAWLLSDQSPSAEGNSHPSVCKAITTCRRLHEEASGKCEIAAVDRSRVASVAGRPLVFGDNNNAII